MTWWVEGERVVGGCYSLGSVGASWDDVVVVVGDVIGYEIRFCAYAGTDLG